VIPNDVMEMVSVQRYRVDLQTAEKMGRGEHYSQTNIIHLDYTPDVVMHLVRYMWPYLEGMSELNEQIQCIWIDLNTAVAALEDDSERGAIQLLTDGWAPKGKYADIGREMGLKPPMVRKLMNRAFRNIAIKLGYGAE
jgi:hypothetical protein